MQKKLNWDDFIGNFIEAKAKNPNFLNDLVAEEKKKEEAEKSAARTNKIKNELRFARKDLQNSKAKLSEHLVNCKSLTQEEMFFDQKIQGLQMEVDKFSKEYEQISLRNKITKSQCELRESAIQAQISTLSSSFDAKKALIEKDLNSLIQEKQKNQFKINSILKQIESRKQKNAALTDFEKRESFLLNQKKQLKNQIKITKEKYQKLIDLNRKSLKQNKKLEEKAIDDCKKRLKNHTKQLKALISGVIKKDYKLKKQALLQEIYNICPTAVGFDESCFEKACESLQIKDKSLQIFQKQYNQIIKVDPLDASQISSKLIERLKQLQNEKHSLKLEGLAQKIKEMAEQEQKNCSEIARIENTLNDLLQKIQKSKQVFNA